MPEIKEMLQGKESDEAIRQLQDFIKQEGVGEQKVNYRLRDWLISRQRYWGAPIPVVYCEKCGIVSVDESQLPVLLPEKVENWQPRGGESPLASVEKWVETYCPECGEKARRETDTMDTFVDSSWYFLRYTFEQYKQELKNYDIIVIDYLENKEERMHYFSEVADKVNEVKFFEIDSEMSSEEVIQAFESFLNGLDNNVIVFAGSIASKILAYVSNPVIAKEIILLDSYDILRFFEAEYVDLPLERTSFVSSLPSAELESNAFSYGFRFFKLSGNQENFSDNIEELKDFLDFAVLDTLNIKPWDRETVNSWLPVDNYVGGVEHATMHLLYARFVIKALRDMGHLDFKEPFINLFTQGMVNYKGKKMSKSKGNVVNPDEIISEYGIDTMRCYLFFMGPPEEDKEWSDNGIVGVYRWLQKVYKLATGGFGDNLSEERFNAQKIELHKTIKKVKEDVLSKWQPNTALATMMEFTNFLNKESSISKEIFLDFLKLLAPFASFISDYFRLEISGEDKSVFEIGWPEYNEEFIQEAKVKLAVQFNGKFRGTIELSPNASKEDAIETVKNDSKLSQNFSSEPQKVIYVPGKIVNIIL